MILGIAQCTSSSHRDGFVVKIPARASLPVAHSGPAQSSASRFHVLPLHSHPPSDGSWMDSFLDTLIRLTANTPNLHSADLECAFSTVNFTSAATSFAATDTAGCVPDPAHQLHEPPIQSPDVSRFNYYSALLTPQRLLTCSSNPLNPTFVAVLIPLPPLFPCVPLISHLSNRTLSVDTFRQALLTHNVHTASISHNLKTQM